MIFHLGLLKIPSVCCETIQGGPTWRGTDRQGLRSSAGSLTCATCWHTTAVNENGPFRSTHSSSRWAIWMTLYVAETNYLHTNCNFMNKDKWSFLLRDSVLFSINKQDIFNTELPHLDVYTTQILSSMTKIHIRQCLLQYCVYWWKV